MHGSGNGDAGDDETRDLDDPSRDEVVFDTEPGPQRFGSKRCSECCQQETVARGTLTHTSRNAGPCAGSGGCALA